VSDFGTMVWKESKDTIFSGNRGEWIIPLLVLAIMGVVIPWQFGEMWLSLSPAAVFIVAYIPFFLTSSYIGDAVAGERERHTLETLLASRIPERVILRAKLAVAIGYAWGLPLIGLLPGWITANLFSGQGRWEFYHPLPVLLELVGLSFLTSMLSASAGVLISLRAATVRQAQQTIAVGSLVLIIALVLILRAVPAEALAALNAFQFYLYLIGGFALLDFILAGILSIRFRRARLILS
jgi:ABC-2 type transport system permease protein